MDRIVRLDVEQAPRVSVVMAAYNAAEFLRQAIDSILRQTFGDFEFIIVDDGSADDTAAIVRSYADPRIRLVQNQRNLGLARALNMGIDAARGEYIARMDADDESLPTRFEEQVRFLDAHPEIGLCGTQIETMGARVERWIFECEPKRLKAHLLFSTSMSHPSVMFRRSVAEAHGLRYDPAYPLTQDYALWVCFSRVTDIANLPQVLVRYRLHGQSASSTKRAQQQEISDGVRRQQLQRLGIEPAPKQMVIHTTLMRGTPHTLALDVDEAEAWLVSLLEANRRSGVYDQAALLDVIYEMWFKLCRAHRQTLGSAYRRFLESDIAREMFWANRIADGTRLFLLSRNKAA